MKFQAEIGDEFRTVEIIREGEKVLADIDGRKYELEVSEPEPNVLLMKLDGKVVEAFIEPGARLGETQTVTIRGQNIELRLVDPKRLRGSIRGDSRHRGAAEIRTAMPGKVVRILLEPGAEVRKGDGVIVVEAMKMQNELKSPRDGKISSINTSNGATVGAGEVLATID